MLGNDNHRSYANSNVCIHTYIHTYIYICIHYVYVHIYRRKNGSHTRRLHVAKSWILEAQPLRFAAAFSQARGCVFGPTLT